MFVDFIYRVEVGQCIITYLLDQRVRMKWAFSKKFGRQMVNEVSKRFNIKGVVQMGEGSSPGIVSDNAQALVLDELEFEVI
jgi:hypothetical protein